MNFQMAGEDQNQGQQKGERNLFHKKTRPVIYGEGVQDFNCQEGKKLRMAPEREAADVVL